jgi:hypothetical protein
MTTTPIPAERADLLQALAKHRWLFRLTVEGLTDEEAARRPTASELCLGGLIKHVGATESLWCDFIEHGPAEQVMGVDEAGYEAYANTFRMLEGETLLGLLERYEAIAQRTDDLVVSLPDLDVAHPLPEAPWFEPGAHWTARRTFLHILAETTQHAGHADILRETLDGGKSMG